MSSELRAGYYLPPRPGAGETAIAPDPLFGRTRRAWASVPASRRNAGIALLGALAAGGVGWLASRNPSAAPPHLAVALRVAIILALVGAGIYARTSDIQARIGTLLLAMAVFSSLWLLNGSSNRLLFSIGVLCSGPAAVLFSYLMLTVPTGRLASTVDRRFLWVAGGAGILLWILGVLIFQQPPLRTPLLRCTPHCPANSFSLAIGWSAPVALKAMLMVAWVAVACGTPVLLLRQARLVSAPVRRALAPTWFVGTAYCLMVLGYLVSRAAGFSGADLFGTLEISLALATPLAFLIGLRAERLFMAHVLAGFLNELDRLPNADPQALMAEALDDPSLRIFYRRPEATTYVDSAGVEIDELGNDRPVTWVERNRDRIAAVTYDPRLAGQERYVHAAAVAALMRLERAQLEADLKTSITDLRASRIRMAEAAHDERRRLERDLHDGVQQQLVGVRIKLDLAAAATEEDPARGIQSLSLIGAQLDGVLSELRSVARGIYPSLLHERGLEEALKSAARSAPRPAVFRAFGIGRYAEDVEVAVYYCCLEALQNVIKHAGPVVGTITLRQDGSRLSLEVRDSGAGFDPERAAAGAGTMNMRDRLQTVGGTLHVVSRVGAGTSVRGSVPVA